MSKFPVATPRWPAPAASVLLAASLAACVAAPSWHSLPVNSETLLDDYILVHGMAEGTVVSPGVPPTAVSTIARLDLDAQMALRQSEEAPGSTAARDRAKAAIQRLSDYAARVNQQGSAPVAVGGGQS